MFGFLFGNKNVKTISGSEAKEILKKDKKSVLIDVRSSGEVSSGMIKGAKNIDVSSSQFSTSINKLDKNRTYILYCASGARSNRAAGIMTDNGFERVYNVQGGIRALI